MTRLRSLDVRSAGDALHLDVVSDLHHGEVYGVEVRALAEELRGRRPDVVAVAGDVADTPEFFAEALELFSGPWPLLVIAGNHDVWSAARREEHAAQWEERPLRTGLPTSQELFEETLPQLCRQAGAIWLEEESVVLPAARLAVVGSIGWYDYSADETGRSLEEIAVAKAAQMADADRIDWPFDDLTFARQCRQRVARALEAASSHPQVDQIVALTHVPPFASLRRGGRQGDHNQAYYFHPTLGQLFLDHPKVRHTISGHTHQGATTLIPRPDAGPALQAQVVDNHDRNDIVRLSFALTDDHA